MTRKKINIFRNGIYSKVPKQNYITCETNVYYIDTIKSLEILELNDHAPETNRNYRCLWLRLMGLANFGCNFPSEI